jgi:hypothetical protein
MSFARHRALGRLPPGSGERRADPALMRRIDTLFTPGRSSVRGG